MPMPTLDALQGFRIPITITRLQEAQLYLQACLDDVRRQGELAETIEPHPFPGEGLALATRLVCVQGALERADEAVTKAMNDLEVCLCPDPELVDSPV